MIGDVLVLLKNRLNSHFRTMVSGTSGYGEEKVFFIDSEVKTDQPPFKLDTVSILLFNVEQEKAFRQGEPYVRLSSDGVSKKVQPDIALNLYILVSVRFKVYEQGLHYLSLVIKYFQGHNCLDHENTPELSDEIDHLIIELFSMTVTQQNELWGSLRTGYLPSVAYKVKAVIFQTEDTIQQISTSESSSSGRLL
ncbi:MAG: DUF4255 domain-containing protein [Methylococcaceae bacterium]|nr:DUF4255 domain-containing protein [Methylococcaceae bacterium]MDD1615175.1 DUF4255 domain-containing protein [Methylococcaceae bacterium]